MLRSGWAQHQRALARDRHHHAGRTDELVQHQLLLHFENAKRRTMQTQLLSAETRMIKTSDREGAGVLE